MHSHCSAAVMHNIICEHFFAQWQAGEEQRRQQHAAARTLGLMGARSSELIGAAVGAVGAASAAASRYFVAGAAAGAYGAWSGSRLQEPPRLEVQLPRPAGLPPCALESAEAATREANRQATEKRHRELEERIRQLTEFVASQGAQFQ